ncbi:hypothetical protein D3C73_1581300 [compost metagenome]
MRFTADTDPTAFGEDLVGLGKTLRGGHRSVVPGTTLFVATAAQWGDVVRADLAGLLKDGGGGFFIDRLGQAR